MMANIYNAKFNLIKHGTYNSLHMLHGILKVTRVYAYETLSVSEKNQKKKVTSLTETAGMRMSLMM